jgi:hypothetical protein
MAYRYLFVLCGLIYIVALGLIHLIVPRLEPVHLEGELR